MRNLKRIFAIVLAVAMMCTLISVNTFAEETTYEMTYKIRKSADATDAITATKANKTVYVDCYLTPAEYLMLDIEYEAVVGDFAVGDGGNVTFGYPGYQGTGINTTTGRIYLSYWSGVTVTADTPIATIAIAIPDGVTPQEDYKLVKGCQVSATVGQTSPDAVLADATIDISEAWEIKGQAAVAKEVGLGTAEADLGLPTEVTAWSAAEYVEATTKTESVAVGAWTCTTEGGYNKDVAGAYTFEAEFAPTEDQCATVGEMTKATATVTVGKIALPETAIVLDDVAVKQDKNAEADALWSDLVESGDLELPEEVTIGEGAYEKTYAITNSWTLDGEGTGKLDLVNPTDDSTYSGNVVNLTTTVSVADDAWYADGTITVDVQVYVKKKTSSSSSAPGYGVPVGGNKVDSTTTPEDTTKPEDTTTPEDTTKPEDTTTPEDTTKPEDTTTPDVVAGPFEDVAADHWAAASIETLKAAGIIGGKTATEFAPDADITRAEVAKMVVGLMGLEVAGEAAFADCGADDWFTPYVAAAAEAGLVNGVSETEFAPNRTITRQEAFTIIGRAIAAVTGEADAIDFTDASAIEEYAAPYIALLVEMGIVNGYEDGSIRPVNNITRAEVAKVIAALMDIVNAEVEEEVTEEVTEETTEEVTDETVEETTEETAEEVTEETTEETTEEETAEETTEEAAE